MHKPANDFLRLTDPDGAGADERLEIEVKTALIRHKSLKYKGRTDLLELALTVGKDLQRLNRELLAAHREKRPKPERQALLNQETAKARELGAIEMAMDEETRAKFWAIDLGATAK